MNPQAEMSKLLGAALLLLVVASCSTTAPTPSAAGSPAASTQAAVSPSEPPLPSSTATPVASRGASGQGLALGPLPPGTYRSSFYAPFAFTVDQAWQVTGDSTSQLALADAGDPTSVLTFGKPFGYADNDELLASWKRQGLFVSTNPATIGGLVGVRFDIFAKDDIVILYPTRELGDTLFGLEKGESGRVFLAEAKQGPVVITIVSSDPATFAVFAVRADKLLANVKFLP
jgi:hypothetical protein